MWDNRCVELCIEYSVFPVNVSHAPLGQHKMILDSKGKHVQVIITASKSKSLLFCPDLVNQNLHAFPFCRVVRCWAPSIEGVDENWEAEERSGFSSWFLFTFFFI